jgi:NAD(P)H-hydrate epimerase
MDERIIAFFGEKDPAAAADFFRLHQAGCTLVDSEFAAQLLKPRRADSHKGDFGHALLVAGSPDKPGASILAAKAALRTGCGLLTAMIPKEAKIPLLTIVPEAMTLMRDDSSTVFPPLAPYQAVGFGPGAGDSADRLLLHLLQAVSVPMVIDADGLNLLAGNKAWYSYLTTRHVLTPHPKEFDRLTQPHSTRMQRLQTQLAFAREHGAIVLLKGQYTTVCDETGHLYINTSGNSGMATAGSGDVLTGMILALLAQGYAPVTAAVLGAFIHGYVGDRAAELHSKTSLIATDIIEGIGSYFSKFEI